MRRNNKDKIDKIFKYFVLTYFVISPLFDTVFLYSHLTTIIRILCLFGFCLITFITKEDSRKKMLYLLAFYLAMAGYLVLAYFHSKGFTSFVPDVSFNLVSEISTLLKLAMPFTILYILRFSDITKKEFMFVITSWSVLIAGSVVLCNICGCSLSSYQNEITHYSIFSWGESLGVNEMATKGFFVYANQVSVNLLSLLIFSFYGSIYRSKKYYILFGIVMLAMWMLGTRVSTYGGLLVAVFLIFTYIGYAFLKKEMVSKRLLLPTVLVSIWCIVLPFTPCNDRLQEISNAKANRATESIEGNGVVEESQIESEAEIDEDLLYIESNINKDTIGRQFYTEYYPYKNDMDFWKKIVELQQTQYIDYRKMEILIINRVWEVDDRKSDYFFGISNSVVQKVTNIERDFVLQYYAFGILGSLIVLSFYIYTIFAVVEKTLKNLNFINISITCSIAVFLFASFMTGNSLHFLATIVPMSFIVSFIGKYNDC